MANLEVQQSEDPTLELTDEDIVRMQMVDLFRRKYDVLLDPHDLESVDLPKNVRLSINQTAYAFRALIGGNYITEAIVFRNRRNGRPNLRQTGEIMQFPRHQ